MHRQWTVYCVPRWIVPIFMIDEKDYCPASTSVIDVGCLSTRLNIVPCRNDSLV